VAQLILAATREHDSGVLSGTVYLPDGTTQAGAGVQVTAKARCPTLNGRTNSSGFFQIREDFPEGLYTLTASDPVSRRHSQMKVTCTAGQTPRRHAVRAPATINVTLWMELARSGSRFVT